MNLMCVFIVLITGAVLRDAAVMYNRKKERNRRRELQKKLDEIDRLNSIRETMQWSKRY